MGLWVVMLAVPPVSSSEKLHERKHNTIKIQIIALWGVELGKVLTRIYLCQLLFVAFSLINCVWSMNGHIIFVIHLLKYLYSTCKSIRIFYFDACKL